jgi:2-oxoisovalerate dehydrogenase E1 component
MSLDALSTYLAEPDSGLALSGADPNRPAASYHPSLKVADLLDMFRTMVLSRLLDEREFMLQKQMQAWFSIFGAGKEAAQAAAGKALRPTDPLWGYYRDRAITLQRGVTPFEMLQQAVSADTDPASAGRQMPAHFGHADKAVVIQGSPTGFQCIPSVGLAEAIARTTKLLGKGRYPADAVVYTSVGDATTAEGEVYEALRAAILSKAPVIFHLQDDGFGISVPVEEQVPGEDVLALFRGWPQLAIWDIDGTEIRDSYDAFTEAAAHARARRGPALVRTRALRLMSHSSTDDMRKYRPAADIAKDWERDPIPKFARQIVTYELATRNELAEIVEEARAEVAKAAGDALREPKVNPKRFLAEVYGYEPAAARERWSQASSGRKSSKAGQVVPLADSMRHALHELMELEPRIVMWGEDIADLSRRTMERTPGLKGKGGVFGITEGLQRAFGSDRVANAPIAEATIVGRAVGQAIQGFLPVVEVQFRDYLNPAWQQLVDQAATLRWRSGGNFSCPMVIRMSYGGYLGGAGAMWHSEAANGPILNHPGLRVCVPGNARDAVGLLRAAAFCNDIVLYMEPKALYRRNDEAFGLAKGEYMEQPYPDYTFVAWPGVAATYGKGKDLAIITYGNTTPLSMRAMHELEKDGIRSRVIDLRWLNPLDEKAIKAAADDCGKVLVVDEDRRTCGAGAAIADVIYKDRRLRKRVEIERVAAMDCRVSYGPIGERAVLPQVEDILAGAHALLGVKSRKSKPAPRKSGRKAVAGSRKRS